MRFEITQSYDSPAGEVVRAYADPDLYRSLQGLPMLGEIEVLDSEDDGDEVTIRTRYRYTGDLPPGANKVVDPKKLSWVQVSVHDLSTGSTTLRLDPDHYPDRLEASGTMHVTEDGDGAERTVAGDLKVHVLLVAGKVERALVEGLEEYLVAEASAVDEWIAAQ